MLFGLSGAPIGNAESRKPSGKRGSRLMVFDSGAGRTKELSFGLQSKAGALQPKCLVLPQLHHSLRDPI
jgi:hypothetical protein